MVHNRYEYASNSKEIKNEDEIVDFNRYTSRV